MSQLANRGSLTIPGFRGASSNLGLPVPTSLRCRSKPCISMDRQSPKRTWACVFGDDQVTRFPLRFDVRLALI